MQNFKSEVKTAQQPLERLYQKISDFEALSRLMPEQIVNWRCDEDTCSFTITGMADISMRYSERAINKHVRIVSEKSPFPFEILISLDSSDTDHNVHCQTILSADMNSMLSMLASRPLKHLVETINTKLVEEDW